MLHITSIIVLFIASSYSFRINRLCLNGRNSLVSCKSNDWIDVVLDRNLSTPQRLDIQLSTAFPQHSRSYLSSLCESELVLVNGRPQDKKYKVKPHDSIQIKFLEKEVSSVELENIPLDIIYEDHDIIVVNKPVGMVVHPAPGSTNGTFVNALLHHLGPTGATRLLENTTIDMMAHGIIAMHTSNDDYDGEDVDDIDLPETSDASKATPRSLRPGIVHRLDKGTSGVLLAGKHSDAVSKLSKLFAQRLVRKVYLVICIGHPGGSTTIYDPIGRSTRNRQLMVAMDGPPGKPAVSHVKTIAFDGKLSAALVRIETGRTHQIRVHLQARRTPVAGDDDYGNKEWNKKLMKMLIAASSSSSSLSSHQPPLPLRPLLHAYEMEIMHPYTNKKMIFRAPVPEDIAVILRRLSPLQAIDDAMIHDATSGSRLLDKDGYLTVSTEVVGRTYAQGEKTTFVPSERVVLELDVDEWMDINLGDD